MSNIGHNQNFVGINSLTEEQKNKLREAVKQMNDSLTRVAAERDHQKAIIDGIHDSTGVDKKLVRRMSKVYFKANYTQEQEDNRQFEEFYDGVMK